MEVSGQLHVAADLPRGISALCQLYKRLGGPQSRFGRSEIDINILPLPGIEP
jgi:hypothetical protein